MSQLLTPDEIKAKIEQLSVDIGFTREWVHGDEEKEVMLGDPAIGGPPPVPTPSIRKLVHDFTRAADGQLLLATEQAGKAADCRDEACACAVDAKNTVNKANAGIIAEGDKQRELVRTEGETQIERARREADRAWQAAETAEAVTGIGIASRTKLGLVQIGKGISVTPEGVISVKTVTVVNTPVVSFPAEVGIGYTYTAVMSAETSVTGAEISHFEVTFEDRTFIVPATDGHGEIELVPTGDPDVPGLLVVVAVDTLENMSLDAKHSFIRRVVYLGAPAILDPADGATGVSVSLVVSVEEAAMTGAAESAVGTHIQVAEDEDFDEIVAEYGPSDYTLFWQSAAPVGPSTTYYIRARHEFAVYGWSHWGEVSSFRTMDAAVLAPTITDPGDGAEGLGLRPIVTLTAFANVGPEDTANGTQVQIATDAAFTDIAQSYDGEYAISWTPENNLALNTRYYIRARHSGNLWSWSAWSAVVSITTTDAYLSAPVVTSPAMGATGVTVTPIIQTAEPNLAGQTITLKQVQVSTASDFASTRWDSGQITYTADNKTTVSAALAKNTYYYVRVRLCGSITGWTDWSAAQAFTTVSAVAGDSWSWSGSSSFTVPVSGTYYLTAAGAGGGGCARQVYGTTYARGGTGQSSSTSRYLEKGTVLGISVGGGGGQTWSFSPSPEYVWASGGGSSSIGSLCSGAGGGGGGVRYWYTVEGSYQESGMVYETIHHQEALNGTSYSGGGGGGYGPQNGSNGWCSITFQG